MRSIKQRISIFLCIFLVFPTILGCLPMTKLEAQAATVYYYWESEVSNEYVNGESIRTIKTEAGQTFNLGDYLNIGVNYNYTKANTRKDVTYTSSNTSVATVGRTSGKVTTVKTGATEITITCQGAITKCTVAVVNRGALGISKYADVTKSVNALVNAYGSGLKTSNQYKVSNLISKLDSTISNRVTKNGFKYKKVSYSGGFYYSNTNELVVPSLNKVADIRSKLNTYVKSNNPIGTNASKAFKISSISAPRNSKKFTVTLNSKVTVKQIFAIKEFVSWDTYRVSANTAKFPVYVADKSSKQKYYGVATVTKGSKKLSVELYNLKLKKGKSYQLYGTQYGSGTMKNTWTKAKTFKVK